MARAARGSATDAEWDDRWAWGAGTLSQWRAVSAVDPPRSIPNRVVKRGSAEGTGGVSAGRVGPCVIPVRLETGG